jgi:rhodanese-related sulfurtransferase
MSAVTISEISVVELDRRRCAGEKIALLDVREPWEVELCSISGSLFLPLATLPEHVGGLPRDRLLVVICHHGVRSRNATAWLLANGLDNAVNLVGGIDAWAREIDSSMRVY